MNYNKFLVTLRLLSCTVLNCLVFVLGCSENTTYDYKHLLTTVDLKACEKDLQQNLKQGDFRAVAIMGQGRIVPAFNGWETGVSEAILAHEKVYGIRVLAGTSDVIESDAARKYQSQAFKYAETYNTMLLKHLKKQGTSKVSRSEET